MLEIALLWAKNKQMWDMVKAGNVGVFRADPGRPGGRFGDNFEAKAYPNPTKKTQSLSKSRKKVPKWAPSAQQSLFKTVDSRGSERIGRIGQIGRNDLTRSRTDPTSHARILRMTLVASNSLK